MLVTFSGFFENRMYDETDTINSNPVPNGNSGTTTYSSDSAVTL